MIVWFKNHKLAFYSTWGLIALAMQAGLLFLFKFNSTLDLKYGLLSIGCIILTFILFWLAWSISTRIDQIKGR